MSFWEDASPVVKGSLVFGVIGIIISGYLYFSDAGADEGDLNTAQQRGYTPPAAASE